MEDDTLELVEEFLDKLEDRVDSVRIFITRYDKSEGKTEVYSEGSGNTLATEALVRKWLIAQDQYTKTAADVQQRNLMDKDSDTLSDQDMDNLFGGQDEENN